MATRLDGGTDTSTGATIGRVRGEWLLRSVMGKAIRDQSRGIVWWTLGLIAIALLYLSVYPSYRDNPEALTEEVNALPEGLAAAFGLDKDLSGAAGYLGATLFSVTVPGIFIAFGIVSGVRAIAGDEDGGALDLVLSLPVRRARFVWERFGAIAVLTAWLGLVMFLAIVLIGLPVELDLPAGNVAAAVVGVALMGVTYGTFALALGAMRGRPGFALGVSVAVALASYVANALASTTERLDWLRYLSPFWYALGNDPLANGVRWSSVAVLVLLTLVFLGVALNRFEQRDIGA